MMHTTILIVAILVGVSAISGKHLTFKKYRERDEAKIIDSHKDKRKETYEDTSKTQRFETQNQYYVIEPWIAPLKQSEHTQNLSTKHKTNATQSSKSNENISSEAQENAVSSDSQETVELWKPPPYFESLGLFEVAQANIKSNLKCYDYNYKKIVISLAKKAVVKPREAAERMRCVFRRAEELITRIKSLMYNDWTQLICNAQPEACNTVIFSHIKICEDPKLAQEADILLKLGDAAVTYLSSYANTFESTTGQNAYMYLIEGKEDIRELVEKNAIALEAVFPKGLPPKVSCS